MKTCGPEGLWSRNSEPITSSPGEVVIVGAAVVVGATVVAAASVVAGAAVVVVVTAVVGCVVGSAAEEPSSLQAAAIKRTVANDPLTQGFLMS